VGRRGCASDLFVLRTRKRFPSAAKR
jgi:hypothetical protein